MHPRGDLAGRTAHRAPRLDRCLNAVRPRQRCCSACCHSYASQLVALQRRRLAWCHSFMKTTQCHRQSSLFVAPITLPPPAATRRNSVARTVLHPPSLAASHDYLAADPARRIGEATRHGGSGADDTKREVARLRCDAEYAVTTAPAILWRCFSACCGCVRWVGCVGPGAGADRHSG